VCVVFSAGKYVGLHRKLCVHTKLPAFEDGRDRVFRNVGIQNSYGGILPRRKHTTFRTRRKFDIKNCGSFFVETILNIYIYMHPLGKMQIPSMLKLVARIMKTGIYGVKKSLVTLGLHGKFKGALVTPGLHGKFKEALVIPGLHGKFKKSSSNSWVTWQI
jgi:hypothetical protein